MSEQLDFDKILIEHRGDFHEAQLRLQPNHFTIKNKKTAKSEQLPSDDIENMYWLKRSKGNCFKVLLKNGNTYRFDGFQEADYQKLDDFATKKLGKSVEKAEQSIKGWNWGKANFIGDSLSFEADGKASFEVPLKNVSNTNVSKNEAILQFHQNEDAAVSLMEIRFHVPNLNAESETDPAQEFIDKVLSLAEIQHASDADAICTLTELNCITPRGRYDVKFFTDFIDLHGKTFDYKISYDHILRLFLLPHKDGRQMYFVIAMDPPMKQGNTRYPFLIVLFNIDEVITVDLTISDKTKEKFGDQLEKLDKTITGPYHEVVSRICRTVLDKKITVPGNFTTAAGAKCYSCSYKASSGFLYPLERGFMFVTKPVLHILFSDITCVKFDRSNQGTRSFDFEIEHKNGTKHLFSGIEKTEQERFQEFASQKGINVAKSGKAFTQKTLEIQGDDGHDAYAERMKAEGRRGKADDDDDDDEEDEDFQAGSESEDDIDYDSDASVDSGSSGDSDESGSGSGGDDDDDDESGGDKKKKAPAKKPSKEAKKKSSGKDKSPVKRSADSKKDTAKKAKPAAKANTSGSKPSGDPSKQPKSKEFIEDSGSDSD